MQSSIYRDIIDDKIAEWQNGLKKLEEQAGKAHFGTKAKINEKMEQFKAAIDAARVQLLELDQQETVSNTMETKDKILEIFNSIDKNFKGYYEDETPYML